MKKRIVAALLCSLFLLVSCKKESATKIIKGKGASELKAKRFNLGGHAPYVYRFHDEETGCWIYVTRQNMWVVESDEKKTKAK